MILERRGGRFALRGQYHRPETCGALRIFRIERAVFGGPRNRALVVSYRTVTRTPARITVLRGTQVVARRTQTLPGNVTHVARFGSARLPRGDYRVRITVGRGSSALSSSLVARRL